jgi:hypothetical protein
MTREALGLHSPSFDVQWILITTLNGKSSNAYVHLKNVSGTAIHITFWYAMGAHNCKANTLRHISSFSIAGSDRLLRNKAVYVMLFLHDFVDHNSSFHHLHYILFCCTFQW